ncbi:MAG: cell division protein ZapE [Hyphomicrobiales bacterium]
MNEPAPHTSVLAEYEKLAARGEIERDPAQVELARRLDDLNHRLVEKRLANKGSALGWLFQRNAPKEIVRGLYIWGEVGRGKSMLMDLFFSAAVPRRRRRVHFHEFMQETHERIHAFRQALKRGEVKGDDPIPPVAARIAEDTRLLCFDEFHVADIADAMILGRLFTRLFEAGVVVVATSNVAPEGLYKDGLNRQLFLPFIKLLGDHVEVARLDARTDFRLEKLESHPVYYTPADARAAAGLGEIWRELTGTERGGELMLEVKGRQVRVPEAAHGVARFGFADLCEQPLGAGDFLKIAHSFHTVVLDGIPVMDDARRNEARRFITLIDALYDNRVKLVASAEAEPDGLYRGTIGHEVFAFQRTASRLIEMRSGEYLAAPHGSVGTAAPEAGGGA